MKGRGKWQYLPPRPNKWKYLVKRARSILLWKLFGVDFDKISDSHWAHIFRQTIENSPWLQNKSLSPGRAAIDFCGLYVLYRIYNDFKPKKIIEFGLGQSSKIGIQYTQNFSKESTMTIVDHSAEWIDFFKNSFPIPDSVDLVCLPIKEIVYSKCKTTTYENILTHAQSTKYDFLIVDGPYGCEYFSRFQIIELLDNGNINDSFVIFIDDYDRIGEQATANLIMSKLKELKIDFAFGTYFGEKGQIVICSADNKFLCSL